MNNSLGIIGGNFGKALQRYSPVPAIVYDIKEAKSETTYENFIDKVTHVIVATPNVSHFPVCAELLSRGKNVLCLKPFVASLLEAQELFRVARKKRVILKVGFNQRYHEQLKNLTLSQASYLKAFWLTNRTYVTGAYFNTVRHDLGSHLMDFALRHLADTTITRKTELQWGAFQYYSVHFGSNAIRAISLPFIKNQSVGLKLDTKKGKVRIRNKAKDPADFNDHYTFAAMITDFLSATRSDDEKHIYDLIKAT